MGSTSFNFNQAVADARRDYPQETENTTFIQVGLFRGRREIRQWEKKNFYTPAGLSKAERRRVKKKTRELIHDLRNKSGISAVFNESNNLSILCLGNKKETGLLYSLQFQFDHELGHIVVPNAHPQNLNKAQSPWKKRQQEEIADAFALLRGWRQGTLEADGFWTLSAVRTKNRLSRRDFIHDTTDGIYKLYNFFSANNLTRALLTPQKVKETAQSLPTFPALPTIDPRGF